MDERLIHGQVTVGWGSRLKPLRYVVIDDGLPDSDFERDLHRLGVPEGSEAEFHSVAEGRARLSGWMSEEFPIVLLTRDLDHMLRLAAGDELRGERVNLGGIHYRAGRTQVLPFLYLGQTEREQIQALGAEGVEVSAQDLPGHPATAGRQLVDS